MYGAVKAGYGASLKRSKKTGKAWKGVNMKQYPISMRQKNVSIYHFYNSHYQEVDETVPVDNNKASFVIKSIIAGIVPGVVVTYHDQVIAGKELLQILHYCFTNKLVFTGRLFEQMNGKTWDEIPGYFRQKVEEVFFIINEIWPDSIPEEVEYFIENID